MAKKTKAERKRTRKNAEKRKIQRQIDKIYSPDTREEPEKPYESVLVAGGGTKPELKTEASKSKAANRENDTKKRKKIMRPLIAISGGFKWCIGFLDRHSGAVIAAATVVIMSLTYIYVTYSKMQWQVAQDTLNISQRAYVTMGRKDGTVADFFIPKDPHQDIEVIAYFQNSGHLPAKFKWGLVGPGFLGTSSKSKSSGLKITHLWDGQITRTEDIKTGSIGERGETNIIAGDSTLASPLGIISQRDEAALSGNDMSMIYMGFYQYCDELGNNTETSFMLRYNSRAPSSNMSFDVASQMPFTFPPPNADMLTPGTVYTTPCETVEERRKSAEMHESLPWWKEILHHMRFWEKR